MTISVDERVAEIDKIIKKINFETETIFDVFKRLGSLRSELIRQSSELKKTQIERLQFQVENTPTLG